jgi:hypothetical protein
MSIVHENIYQRHNAKVVLRSLLQMGCIVIDVLQVSFVTIYSNDYTDSLLSTPVHKEFDHEWQVLVLMYLINQLGRKPGCPPFLFFILDTKLYNHTNLCCTLILEHKFDETSLYHSVYYVWILFLLLSPDAWMFSVFIVLVFTTLALLSFFFSSPELKAQVSYSDRPSVCPSVCL